MTAPIGPGDMALCIRGDRLQSGLPGEEIVEGRVYLIADFDTSWDLEPCTDCGEDGDGLIVAGVPAENGSWCHCNFSPAGRGGMFNDLLTAKPVPADREGVDA